jgi:hypothetical protein
MVQLSNGCRDGEQLADFIAGFPDENFQKTHMKVKKTAFDYKKPQNV